MQSIRYRGDLANCYARRFLNMLYIFHSYVALVVWLLELYIQHELQKKVLYVQQEPQWCIQCYQLSLVHVQQAIQYNTYSNLQLKYWRCEWAFKHKRTDWTPKLLVPYERRTSAVRGV